MVNRDGMGKKSKESDQKGLMTHKFGVKLHIDHDESHGTFHDDKTYSYLRETKPDRIVK